MPFRLAGVAIALLLVAGCDVNVSKTGGVSFEIIEGKASEEWVRSYTLPPGGRLDIINVNGTIEASAATGRQVEVHALREARSTSDEAAQALLKQVQIVEEVTDSHVKVEARGQSNRTRNFGRSRVSVKYTVRLPRGLTAYFKTENGGVRLDNIEGRITAATTNGGITGRGIAGTVNASTVNGGVQMTLASVTGDVALGSVNGGIRLEMPTDIDAQLEVSAVNGGVSIDEAFSLAATEQARRRIAGKLNRGGPKIVAQTTNGGVRVAAAGRQR